MSPLLVGMALWGAVAIAAPAAPAQTGTSPAPRPAAQAGARPASDPCRLRTAVSRSVVELRQQREHAAGRERACWTVVLAQALAREGNNAAAVLTLDEALPDLPELAPFLARARERIALPPRSTSPTFRETPTTADAAADAVTRLLRRGQLRDAAALAMGFQRPPHVHEGLELATVTALVRAGRIDEAIAHVRQLPAHDAFVRVHAWALSKGGRHAEARDVYARLATATTDPSIRAEATFYSAFASYESGDLEAAQALFRTALDVTAGTSFEPSTRWYQALCELLLGRVVDVTRTLDALVRAHPSDREVLKHRYWLARARIATGDRRAIRQGEAELSALAVQDPIEFYGMLARARLKRPPFRGVQIPRDALVMQARSDSEASTVMTLWNIGLDDEARDAARALGTELDDIGVQHAVEDVHNGWTRGARFTPMPRTAGSALVPSPAWRVSYAAPWSDIVDAAGRRHAVPSSFVYAIMRTESGFRPTAISPAGAQGVIQLMPAVARGMCTLTGRQTTDATRLFDIPVAIDLGTALLGRLRHEFGSLMLAAAAYNGGGRQVVAWLEQHRGLEPELFIERIPFKETRDYVKRVLAAEALYRALDGGVLSLDLPVDLPPPPETFTDFDAGD